MITSPSSTSTPSHEEQHPGKNPFVLIVIASSIRTVLPATVGGKEREREEAVRAVRAGRRVMGTVGRMAIWVLCQAYVEHEGKGQLDAKRKLDAKRNQREHVNGPGRSDAPP